MATRSTPALERARVVVVGLGRTGQAAVRFLSSRGAQVTVSERRPRAVLEPAAAEAEALGATLEDSGHRAETFIGADLVVVSPGVPLVTPALAEARAAGVPVWAEVELAARFLRGTLVGITGSNGKSTTTAWTAHLLQKAGLDATACGNIGVPLLSLVDTDDASRRYVVELSSFQLEGIEQLRPQVAVVTNLTPDHQDRYQGFDDYIAAKERIFCNQGPEDHAVLNADDDRSRDLACREGGPARWLFSRTRGTCSQMCSRWR